MPTRKKVKEPQQKRRPRRVLPEGVAGYLKGMGVEVAVPQEIADYVTRKQGGIHKSQLVACLQTALDSQARRIKDEKAERELEEKKSTLNKLYQELGPDALEVDKGVPRAAE